ncbi:hypothetical protein RUND412_011572 [Rhizina undulata]
MYHRHVCDEVVGDFYTFTVTLKYKTPLFHLLKGNNDVERVITLIMNNLSKLGTSWAPIKVDMQPVSPSQGTLAQSTSMAPLPFPQCHPVGSYPTRSPTVALTAESNGNAGTQYGQGRSIREENPHKTPGGGDAAHNVQGQKSPHQIINRDGAACNVQDHEIISDGIAAHKDQNQGTPHEIMSGGGAGYNAQGQESPYEIISDGGVAYNSQDQEIPKEIISGGGAEYSVQSQEIPYEIVGGGPPAYNVQGQEIPNEIIGGGAAYNVQGQEIPNEIIGGGAAYNVQGQEIPNEIIGGGAAYYVQGQEIPYEIVGGGVACNVHSPESSGEIIGGAVAYEANGQEIPSEIMSDGRTAYTVQDQEIPSEITGCSSAATFNFQNQESQTQEFSPFQAIREALWNYEYAGPPNTYSTMKYFHTVFLIDNSVAMSDQSWELAFIIMSEIVPACTNYDRDGVDIYFLNHGRSYVRLHSAQDVANVFCQVRNASVTSTGKRVSEILIQYINKCMQQLKPPKPLNMIVITDGASSFPQLLETCIINTAMELHSHHSPYNHCWIEFLQVGRSETVEHYLEALDKSLCDKFNERDEGSLTGEEV